MQYDAANDSVIISGASLRAALLGSVSDMAAVQRASRNIEKYRIPNDNTRRINLFKARADAVEERMGGCSSSEPWVQSIIRQWCSLSDLPQAEAEFWREPGFMEAVRAGHDLQLRRFIDADGWGWIVLRELSGTWLYRKRLPETVRKAMLQRQQQRERAARRY